MPILEEAAPSAPARANGANAVWRSVGLFFQPLIIPVILLFAWEILSGKGLIRASTLPPPSIIGATLFDLLWTGELFGHLWVSISRVLVGFSFGASLGLGLGFVIGLSKRTERSLALITAILRPVPIIAWIPMLILWMGIDEESKIALIAIGSFWPVLLNVIHGVRNTDRKVIEVARVLRKGPLTLWWRVILPSALPAVFTGLRIGIGIAWMSVVAAELIAASSGIGYLIMYARELSQPDVMLVAVLSIGFTGLLIDLLIRQVEGRALRWNDNIRHA